MRDFRTTTEARIIFLAGCKYGPKPGRGGERTSWRLLDSRPKRLDSKEDSLAEARGESVDKT
jgi:hypothetical protein